MKNVALESVDIELDQLHPAVGAFAQDAVESSRLRRLRLHFATQMLGMQPRLDRERPARIDGVGNIGSVAAVRKQW